MYPERTVRRLRDIVDDAARIERMLVGMDVDAFMADERTVLAGAAQRALAA